MAFDVYAQADVVAARLVLAPRESAGSLETTVMEAVHAGANTMADLTGILGLAPRLVLQVIGDLWRADRIVVELGTRNEVLRLSSEGQRELKQLREDGALFTSASTATTQDLAFERLTGRVLPVMSTRRRVPAEDSKLIIPRQQDDPQLAGIDEAALVAALVRTLEEEGDGSGDRLGNQRVVSAFVEPGQLQVVKRNYHRLRVGAQISASGELTIAVVDERLPIVDRVRATERLQSMVDAEPRSTFTLEVRNRASQELLEPKGAVATLRGLAELVAGMESCAPADRQQVHDQAEAIAQEVVNYARYLAENEVDLSLVRTSDEHHAALIELVSSADRQIVIAVPWIRSSQVLAITPHLQGALDRGVQVVLLWGIGGHLDGLGEAGPAVASLAAYAHQRGRTFLYNPQRAARSHAKVVIADDRRMLVTSKNFLSSSQHAELGVVLDAVGDHPCPAIESALRYVYGKAPDPQVAGGLQRQPGAFGAREDVPRPDIGLPRKNDALLDPDAPRSVVVAWHQAWSAVLPELERLLDRPRPTVRIVADLQHRGLLREALAATTRIALASDRVTEDALTGDVARRAIAAVGVGAEVRLLFRRVDHEEIEGLKALTHAASASPRLSVTRDDRNHAKVVLTDDKVVIGSFNPLSVDAAMRHRRSTGELGLAITSQQVSDAVWLHLGGSPERLLAGTSTSILQGEATSNATSAEARLGQEIAEALTQDSGEELLALVGEHGLEAALAAHVQIGGTVFEQVRIGGAALADVTQQDVGALSLVQAGAVATWNWELAGLTTRLLGDASPINSAIIKALDEGRGGDGAFLTAYLGEDSLSDAEHDALIAVDLVGLLLDTQPEGAASSDDLMGIIDPSAEVFRFVEAAVTYLRAFGRLPGWPPPSGAGGELAAVSTAWQAARDQYQEFATYDSRSRKGDAFLVVLFSPRGEMADLHRALETRDGDAVRSWYCERVRTKDDAKWLDRAVHDAGIERITDNRRKPLLEHRSRLRRVVAQLLQTLDEAALVDTTTWSLEMINAQTILLDEVTALHARLAGTPTVEGRLLTSALDRLLAWQSGAQHRWAHDLNEWPFVSVRLARASDPALSDVETAAAAGRDLAVRRSPREVVLALVFSGAFADASASVGRLLTLGLLDPDEADELSRTVGAARRATLKELNDRLELVRRRCEWAGVPAPTTSRPPGEDVDAEAARVRRAEDEADQAIARRRAELEPDAKRRSVLDPTWLAHIDELLAAGDLLLAEQALQHDRDGDITLPIRPFARWSWREAGLTEIVRWFGRDESAPAGMRNRFIPGDDDPEGQRVMRGLESLATGAPDASATWLSAVQHLVAPAHEHNVEATVAAGVVMADFFVPGHALLPTLRWEEDGVPVRAALSTANVPGVALRFSTEVSATADTAQAVIDVADVLSLLRLADGTDPAPHDRALRFLSLVAGSLPLDAVISPKKMPSGGGKYARRRLGLLLEVVGLRGTSTTDLERLSLCAGQHPGVLWTLVDRARETGIDVSDLLSSTDLDTYLVEGVDTDLDRDDDLVVLAVGLAYELFEAGCSEAALAHEVGEEWTRYQAEVVPQGRPHLLHARVADAVRRLVEAGYLTREDGELRACGCRAVIALNRAALDDEWRYERLSHLDPETLMQAKAYELLEDLIYHEHQAENGRLSPGDVSSQARTRLAQRMRDDTPFDVVRLCRRVADRFNHPSRQFNVELAESEILAGTAGPEVWIEACVRELLNNAVRAMKGLPDGEPLMILRCLLDPEDHAQVMVEVRNNGAVMPDGVMTALKARQRWRSSELGRGNGLYAMTTFGAAKGVTLSVDTTETDDGTHFTIVQLRIPIHPAES